MRSSLLALVVALGVCGASTPSAAAQTEIPRVRPGGLWAGRSQDTLVELARNNAAEQTGVALDEISVVSVEPAEWADFSLGCPSTLPHLVYAEVSIPGFVIQLDVAGTPMTYHTDAGLRAIPCEASPAPPSDPAGEPGG